MTLTRGLWALTVVALLLSAAHLSLAALAARSAWGLPLLWFSGSGLALLVAGLLNVAALRAPVADPAVRIVWVLGNAATAFFFLLAWSLMKQPQVVLGFLTFALLTAGAGLSRPRAA